MSSASGSRDSQSSGTAPKVVPLGYSARVLYTFLPHENEQTEIFVSEGETVQLEYGVGTWVFVTSAEGESGYIPGDFCVPLTGENSHSAVGTTTSGSPTTPEPLGSIGKHETIKDTLIGVSQTPEDKPDVYSIEDNVSGDTSVGIIEHGTKIYSQLSQLNKIPKEIYIPREVIKRPGSGVYISDRSAKTGSAKSETTVTACDICGSYISRLPSQVQGLIKPNRGKADFQSRKLLSETPVYSIHGLLSHLNSDPTVSSEQAYSKGINHIDSTEKYEPAQNILENLRSDCSQCNDLKNYLQHQGENSMSTVFTNNRDLKLDALSDSDSERSAEQKDDLDENDTPSRVAERMENEKGENTDGQIESDDHDSPPPLPNSSPPPLIDLTTNGGDMERPDKVEVVPDRQTIIIDRSPGTRTLPALPKYDSKMAWNDKPLTTPYNQVFNADQTFFDPLLQHMGNPEEDFMRQGSRTTSGFASSEGSVESSEPDKFLGADGKLYDSESDLCVKRVSESSYPSSEEGARPLSGLSDLASPTAISPDGNNVDLLGGFNNSSMSDQDILVPSVKVSNNDESDRTLQSSSSLDVNGISASRNITSANNVVITPPEPDRNSNGAKSENSHTSKILPATPKHFDYRANLMVLGNRPKIQTLPNKLMVSAALRTRQHTTTAMVSSVNNNKREEEPRTKIRPSIITIAPPMGDRMVVARRQQPATPARTNADRQDEKEIKKTLQEHSMSPRRTSQMPMRAHHSIHAEAGKDSRTARPTGRTILVKKHNNQIWRPPTGSPEGSETPRPFSPFGGTLPPSKIGSKKKVVEVFV